MTTDKLIRFKIIPGTIDHFRGIMERIMRDNVLSNPKWTPCCLELGCGDDADGLKTTSAWHVYKAEDMKNSDFYSIHDADACIEAYELPGGQLRIDFLDGYSQINSIQCNPIGQDFEELAERVIAELTASTALGDGQERSEKIHRREIPKEKKARQAKLLELWKANDLKTWQMAARLGCSVSTVNRYLAEMREQGVIES